MFKNIEHWKILGFGFTFALAVTGFVLGLLAYLREDKNDGSDAPVTTKKSVAGVHVDTVNREAKKTYSVKFPTDEHVKLNTAPSGVKVHAVHVPTNTPMYVDKVQNISKTGFEVVIYPLDDGGVDTGFSGTLEFFGFVGHRPVIIDNARDYYVFNSFGNFNESATLAKVADTSILSNAVNKAIVLDIGNDIPMYLGLANSSADLESAVGTNYRMSSVTTAYATDGGMSSASAIDAAMINGKPAVVCIDATLKVSYYQATTSAGTAWGSVVQIDSVPTAATQIKLFTLTIGGTKVPACIFTDAASVGSIIMNYAQDANGAAWNTKGTIVSSGLDTGTAIDAVDLGNGACVIVYKNSSGRVVAHKSNAFTALTGVTLATSHFPSGNAVNVGISGNSTDTYTDTEFSCHMYRDAVHVFMLNSTKAQIEVSYSNGVTASSYTSKVIVGNQSHAYTFCRTAMDDEGNIWIASERANNGAASNIFLTKYETPEAAGIDEIAIHYSTH